MIITKTPFRMSFFGGGTDMESFFKENGGAVLSTTFDKYCYVNVRHLPRFFDYSTKRPNILFVLTDDQGAWAMRCAGNTDIYTPNLDRLAKQGTRFDNFFCASPVCSPARASILTGRIPSRHGVHDWIRCGSQIGRAHV